MQDFIRAHSNLPQLNFSLQAGATRAMDSLHAAAREALEALVDRRVVVAFFEEQRDFAGQDATNIAKTVLDAANDVPTLLHILTFAINWDVFAQPGVQLTSHSRLADVIDMYQRVSIVLKELVHDARGALRFANMLAPLADPPVENCWGVFGLRERVVHTPEGDATGDAAGAEEGVAQRLGADCAIDVRHR